MKILAIERPVESPRGRAPAALLREEAERVWQLQQEGALRGIYWRSEREEAVLVIECQNAEDARRILATLLLVRGGWIAFEVMELSPYPGLARLFAGR